MPRLVTAIILVASAFAVGCSVDATDEHEQKAPTTAGPTNDDPSSSTTTPPSAATPESQGSAAVGSLLKVDESTELLELGARQAETGKVFRSIKLTLTNKTAAELSLKHSLFSLTTTTSAKDGAPGAAGAVPLSDSGDVNECIDFAILGPGAEVSCALVFQLPQRARISIAYVLPSSSVIVVPVPAAEECNILAPSTVATQPVKVRVSTDAAYSLEHADVPDGVFVLHHSELYTDRPRPDFTTPASTIVIRDGGFEEVAVSDVTIRTVGQLDSRSGGNAKLSCSSPTITHRTTDFVSYEKHVGEVVLERDFEGGGVLRRYYRRQ